MRILARHPKKPISNETLPTPDPQSTAWGRFPQIPAPNLIVAAWFLSAVVALCPFRAAAHFAPGVVLVLFLLGCESGERKLLARRLIMLTVAVGSWAIVCSLFNSSVTLQSTLLWGLTWSGCVALLVPMKIDHVSDAIPRIEALSGLLVGVSAVLALAQITYGGFREGTLDRTTGDYVDGFVHPSLEPAGTFANTTFSAAMIALLLIMFGAYLRGRGSRYLVGACFAAIIVGFASVLHHIAFLTLGVIITSALLAVSQKTLQHVPACGAVLASLLLVTVVLHPKNVRSGTRQASTFTTAVTEDVDAATESHTRAVVEAHRAAASESPPDRQAPTLVDIYAAMDDNQRGELSGLVYRSPNAKITLLKAILEEGTTSPAAGIIGWGPGTFASRTAAIRTGWYFGSPKSPRKIPGLKKEVAPLFEKHLIHPWLRVVFAGNKFGSTYKPFSSWMSILSETGLLGVCVLAVLGGLVAATLTSKARCIWPSVVLVTLVGFFFTLGFQEHYWEMPQIALLPLLTIRMYYTLAKRSR